MIGQLSVRLALATAAVAALLSLALVAIKIAHHLVQRSRGVRRAHYISALGEMLARGLSVTGDMGGWARDPLFLEVLLEYYGIVAGEEKATLEAVTGRMELRSHLIRRLRTSRRAEQRLDAVGALADLADESVEWALLEAVFDSLPEVRIQAARGLAAIKSETALDRLIELLALEEPWFAARIADQLVAYGTIAVPRLVGFLDWAPSGSPGVELAIRVAGLIGDFRASDTLVRFLAHPDPEIRVAAASALGNAGTLDCVRRLAHALKDEDWRVRARAAASLATFSDPTTIEPLTAAMCDRSWWVRQNAAESLVEFPGGLDALVEMLSSEDAFARDAALLQLGLKGEIRAARSRLEAGQDSERDRHLVAQVDQVEHAEAGRR